MEDNILNKETTIEENLIQILWKLGVDASVKTNKKSLPYKEVFETILQRTKPYSYSFYWREVYREFIKEILNRGYRKIRFYCELIPIESSKEDNPFHMIDKPNYTCYIKYYIHH